MSDLLERIRASMPALSAAEQRVARLVLADARSFTTLPVGELAARARVSKPTVVRFCRSIGYHGLTDFKRKLAGSVDADMPLVHRAVAEADRPADIIVKVIDNAVAAMLDYRNTCAGHAFERAIEALVQAARGARRIGFYGVGHSGIVARDAQHKFFGLGIDTAAIGDPHEQVMSATLLEPGDVAVVISNSGHSRELIDVVEIARRKGATTVLVTASGTPLALRDQGPDQVLLAVDHAHDSDHYGPTVSRLLHLLVIDILATAVALRLPDERRPVLQEIKKNLRARRHATAA